MAEFDKMLTNTLSHEGGKTVDSGGVTNYGVTQKLYDNVYSRLNLPKKSVNDLTYGEVKKVYKDEFHDRVNLDKIDNFNVRGLMFDWGVNAGYKDNHTIKKLQKIVGTKADGFTGKNTNKKINEYIEKNGEDALIQALLQSRQEHYNELVTEDPEKYGEYQQGWANRIKNLSEFYKAGE